jgi:cysteine desulfurase/selenocysteine lyase
MTTVDWNRIRADFPVLDQQVHGKPLIYFDSAASSQKPRAVIDALSHYYEHDHANVHRGLHELSSRATEAYENARAKVARYLGASQTEEVVFTRGTTESINLVAKSWAGRNLRKGDTILLTEMEHHSNLVPWQMLAERTGAKLRFVPVAGDGTLDFDVKLLEGVKLFSFVHISNSLGTINPVPDLCQAAKAAGATTLVDGAQSAGHLPVNVAELGCDFYAFSGHKKFEAGTPIIADAIGLGTAVDYLEAIGRPAIFAHDSALTDHAIQRMREIPGLRILGPDGARGALVAFHAEWAHPHDLTTFANQHGLAMRGGHHCTQPLMRKLGLPGTTRASFYFYNTMEEVDRMVEILRAAHQFFDR